ncbi:2Fe-2S iron-sulfur cluster binding domain-containing protein [Epibacterium ulvae]|uniref:2Fe-2S iron-sulfur cluster binding domain-containing protein n=1 Tax=Epibacterium ulvae TaxID=1156985 RepID=A0A1G5RJJ8_9RHOB|nr:(2Fe-2S)-binding protein [Epibacterium ulvae]SCZ74217.1 2Fe-2S iron-sulfur cluster binding domain-containing protein [Epibacterium ulvae]
MPIELNIDGTLCRAEEDELLATVLLRQPVPLFRNHPVDDSPRAAFCMMGVCFECLVEVDGVKNQQACLIRVKDGMRVNRGLK